MRSRSTRRGLDRDMDRVHSSETWQRVSLTPARSLVVFWIARLSVDPSLFGITKSTAGGSQLAGNRPDRRSFVSLRDWLPSGLLPRSGSASSAPTVPNE